MSMGGSLRSSPPGRCNCYFTSESEPEPGWLRHLLNSPEVLLIEVAYAYVAGRQEAATTIRLARNDQGNFWIDQVEPLVPRRFTTL